MTTLADGRPATGGPPAHRRSRASRPGRTPPNTLAAVMLTLVWAGAAGHTRKLRDAPAQELAIAAGLALCSPRIAYTHG